MPPILRGKELEERVVRTVCHQISKDDVTAMFRLITAIKDMFDQAESPHQPPLSPPSRITYVSTNECHSFKWSRQLWEAAAKDITRWFLALLVVYLSVSSGLAYADGMRGVDIPYFIVCMVMTIGLGDLSPQSQLHRGATLVMLPFGLVVISFAVSLVTAFARSLTDTAAGPASPSLLVVASSMLLKYLSVLLVGTMHAFLR